MNFEDVVNLIDLLDPSVLISLKQQQRLRVTPEGEKFKIEVKLMNQLTWQEYWHAIPKKPTINWFNDMKDNASQISIDAQDKVNDWGTIINYLNSL